MRVLNFDSNSATPVLPTLRNPLIHELYNLVINQSMYPGKA